MGFNNQQIRAGTLRHVVAIQQRTAIADAMGAQPATWATLATIRAEVAPLSGREILAGQAVRSEVTHQITARYRALFADPKQVAQYRAVYAGRIFNISACLNLDERNRVVVLLASEGLNEG